MKLNRKKIRYLIQKKKQGLSSSVIAVHLKVSKRRVNQIWQEYTTTGKVHINGQNVGRPKKPLFSDEETVVMQAYEKYRFGARMLEPIIRKEWHMIISHNRIHKYLLKLGYAGENERKKKRRRWVRYEGEHSLSAGHIDWHEKLESVTIWLENYSDIDDLYDVLKAQLKKYGSFCVTFNFYGEDLKCNDGN